MVLKVLRFGTRKLFEKPKGGDDRNPAQDQDVRKAYEIDFEALDKLLDRDAQFEQLRLDQEKEAASGLNNPEQTANQGVFDYLAQF